MTSTGTDIDNWATPPTLPATKIFSRWGSDPGTALDPNNFNVFEYVPKNIELTSP